MLQLDGYSAANTGDYRHGLWQCFRRVGMAFGGLLLMATLAGCPSVPKSVQALPAPVTAQRQIAVLNARAEKLATLRLVGNLTLDYSGRLGNSHEYQAHCVLLIDQRPASRIDGRCNLLLMGTYLGEDVLEMGMNQRLYWLVDRRKKTAYVGHFNAPSPSDRTIPMDPRELLQMLAVGGLRQSGTQSVVMTSFSRNPYNRIFVIKRLPNGTSFAQRELVVDRLTGNVVQVSLFNTSGISIARATLSHYQPVRSDTSHGTVMVPMHINLSYPAGNAQIHLIVHKATLRLKVKAKYAFASPGFSGLRVIPVRGTTNVMKGP